MTSTQQIKQKLAELSQLNSRLHQLQTRVSATETLIQTIETSKAYKLKTILVKITKSLGLYRPLLVLKFYAKQSYHHLAHQIGPAVFFQTVVSFMKFGWHHSRTFLGLIRKNPQLFLLYCTNFAARFNEVSIEVIDQKKPRMMARVDIVIPWYGDRNIIKLLLSLKTFDRKFIKTVYVVNDAYPDTHTTKVVFDQLKRLNFSKLKIISNTKNLGFIGSVNHGMRLSKHDVVLLNSDTIPTDGWIDALQMACYQNKKTATATALSNNATIFSLQKFNAPTNDASPGETAKALAALAPVSSLVVPTAHGFCMYIRRSILQKFGYFDFKRYGKGYCEENDYSMRLQKAGYHNVAATKSYVAHLEGQSFSNKIRLEQLKKNYKKLVERYPEYHTFVTQYLKNGQLHQFQKSMSFLLPEWQKRKSYVLLVNHSDIFSAVGGVERTTFEEIAYLSKAGSQNILVYFFDDQQGCYKLLFIEQGLIRKIVRFTKGSKSMAIFKWITTAFKIKLVIGNHLMQHSFKYFTLLKRNQIKNICFVHDYYYLFNTPDLLNAGEFAAPRDAARLTLKLKKQRAAQLALPDTVIFNSEFTQEVYEQFLGKIPNSFVSYPDQLIH